MEPPTPHRPCARATIGKRAIPLRAFLALLCIECQTAFSTPPATPLRVLFVGNSLTYTNDLPGLVQGLAVSAGDAFSQSQVAGGGWDLGMHANYSLGYIDSGNHDIVMLQQHSTGNVIAQDWAVQILNSHAHAAGARSMFFNTPSWDFGPSDANLAQFRQQTALIRYNYAIEGALRNIAISPAGLAWQTVRLNRPDIGMHAPDGHPSLAGSYLMACVHYASLFGRSPAGNSHTAGVADAAYLQGIAEEAVLHNPWAVDMYGYGPNRFHWANNWSQYANQTTSTLQGVVLSGTGGQSSPAVKVDSAVGQIGNMHVGVRDDTYPVPGHARLYLFSGGSLQVTGNATVGKEGRGFVEHRGGTLEVDGNLILAEQAGSVGRYTLSGGILSASQILRGAGSASFTFAGGRLSFHEFGSLQAPMNLTQNGGVLAVGDFAGGPSICGDYSQSLASTLECVADASNTLAITGAATLGGTLTVSYPSGFVPNRGWTCPIVTAASVTGTFRQANLPPVSDIGVIPTITYLPASVVMTAVQDTTDGDGNGLPDWWERRAFGSATSGKAWTGAFKNSGLANGLIFALGSELAGNPADALPRSELSNGQPVIRFIQRIGGTGTVGVNYSVDGLIYTIEVAGNPAAGAWQSGNDFVELVTRTDNWDGTETVVVRLKTPPGPAPARRFARLVVTRP